MGLPLAIPLLTSLAGTAFGMTQSAKINNKRDQLLRKKSAELESWYNNSYNTRYLDTSEGQSILSELYRQTLEGTDRSVRRQKVTGGSNEARIADQTQQMDMIANTINQLAQRGTAYKQNIHNNYMSQKNSLDQQMFQNLQQKDQNWSNFVGNVMNAGIGLAGISGNSLFGFGGDKEGAVSGMDRYNGIVARENASKTNSSFASTQVQNALKQIQGGQQSWWSDYMSNPSNRTKLKTFSN